jgi:hypothetical protein
MAKRCQIVSPDAKESPLSSQELASFLSKEGQLLLPMLDLVEQAQLAIDEVIDVMGRATIEAVLQMSAAELAGPKQQGKKTDREIVYHGVQPSPGQSQTLDEIGVFLTLHVCLASF